MTCLIAWVYVIAVFALLLFWSVYSNAIFNHHPLPSSLRNCLVFSVLSAFSWLHLFWITASILGVISSARPTPLLLFHNIYLTFVNTPSHSLYLDHLRFLRLSVLWHVHCLLAWSLHEASLHTRLRNHIHRHESIGFVSTSEILTSTAWRIKVCLHEWIWPPEIWRKLDISSSCPSWNFSQPSK